MTLKHRPFADALARLRQPREVEVLFAQPAYVAADRVSDETRDWISREKIVAADTEENVTREVSPTDEGVRLYQAAVAADQRLHDVLVRVYGAKRAGDMRYKPTHHNPGVLDAIKEKLAADEKLHEWFEKSRES